MRPTGEEESKTSLAEALKVSAVAVTNAVDTIVWLPASVNMTPARESPLDVSLRGKMPIMSSSI